jgi:hypothetical protein
MAGCTTLHNTNYHKQKTIWETCTTYVIVTKQFLVTTLLVPVPFDSLVEAESVANRGKWQFIQALVCDSAIAAIWQHCVK